MSDILKAIDLSKRFRHTTVLDHMNMNVPEGSVYGLVGTNGAGKTTTIKIVMNILQPTAGAAEILGRDSRHVTARDLTQIGYVSENQELPEWMTVGYFMSYLKPFYPAWDDAQASRMLHQFDLPLDRKISRLSRGMRMKAALAASLAYHPKLLVLDEPFTGLDPLVRDELIEVLLENSEGVTVFLSSHDLAEIESFASHIGYLDRGRLQFSEEMTALAARFREVEVTVDNSAAADPLPPSWVNVEHSNSLLRFVETQFEQDRTMSEIRRLFQNPRITVTPMPLRAIFITLAKAARKAA